MLGTEVISPESIKDVASVTNAVLVFGKLAVVIWLRWFILGGDDNTYPKSIRDNPEAISQFRQFIDGVSWMFAAGVVRIGWWLPGLWFSAEGSLYNEYIETWKWAAYAVASAMFVHGMGRAYDVFEPINHAGAGWRVRFGFGLVGFSWFLTMLAR